MPQNPRKRTLAAATGAGWVQPYGTNPFVFYADGGDDPKGGEPTGGNGDPQGDPAGDPKEPTDPKAAAGDGDEPLGEGGKKALQAEREARQAAEDRVKELEAKLSRKPKDAGAKPGEPGPVDVDAIKQEIRVEVSAENEARLIRAEVKAAAAGQLADPADAPRFVDLSAIKVGEDGEPDAKQIKKAIADLLKEKPYLAATTTQWGDVGGGHHGAPAADVAPGMDRIRHAYDTETTTRR